MSAHTHCRFLSASIDLNSSEDYKGILACSFFVENDSLRVSSSAHLKSSKLALKVKRAIFSVLKYFFFCWFNEIQKPS